MADPDDYITMGMALAIVSMNITDADRMGAQGA